VAYDPATQETVVFAFPSAGESASAARVTYTTRTGQTVTVTGNNFVRQVGTNPPGRPASVNTLPATIQAQVHAAANQATANSQTLIVINLAIPSAEDDQRLAGSGGVAGGGGVVTPVGNGSRDAHQTGSDTRTNTGTPPPPPRTICASPPCE
jgi:hypothetical protein